MLATIIVIIIMACHILYTIELWWRLNWILCKVHDSAQQKVSNKRAVTDILVFSSVTSTRFHVLILQKAEKSQHCKLVEFFKIYKSKWCYYFLKSLFQIRLFVR